MAEEEMVSGDGWISDDSSFYGDENEQERQLAFCKESAHEPFWGSHKNNLNVLLSSLRAHQRKDLDSPAVSVMNNAVNSKIPQHVASLEQPKSLATTVSKEGSSFLLDRKATEEARLARLGKRKREPSPEPALMNPGKSGKDTWQLGESADAFVKRLPPLTTTALTGPWIWAHDPRHSSRESDPHIDDFISRGTILLKEAQQRRQSIEEKGRHGSKATLAKSLTQESKALQQRITDLAVECNVLSGKWMLFPSLENVTHTWKAVVEGIIDSRLGPTAKVATDDGSPGDRLICVYTKDFRDEDDVAHILQQLETMGVLPSGRSIYYKSDAYTYLNLYKDTAAEYGLQASLYNSFKMMNASRLSKTLSPGPQKKQTKLNSYF